MHLGKVLRKDVKPKWAINLLGDADDGKVKRAADKHDDEEEEEEEEDDEEWADD